MLSVRRLVVPCTCVTIVLIAWNIYTDTRLGKGVMQHVVEQRSQSANSELTDSQAARKVTYEQFDAWKYSRGSAARESLQEPFDDVGIAPESSDLDHLSTGVIPSSSGRVGDLVTYSESVGSGVQAGELNKTTDAVMQLKTILLWNSHFGKADYGFGLGAEAFRTHHCAVQACELSTNHSLLPRADAILFHAFSTHHEDMPRRPNLDQIWVFFSMESPLTVETQLLGTNDRYNLTYTYLEEPDTDIVAGVRRLKAPSVYTLPAAFPNKTRAVVWAVSNCHAGSARGRYVRELARYIDVDIYGECGNLTCSKTHNHNCLHMWADRYHFFLAFENSYCRGYITEKVYRTLRGDIIPVVMGAVDYARVLPEKSVIDVRDYSSPRALASFLRYLMDNHTAYREYFRWKTRPSGTARHHVLQSKRAGFCQLCSILHNSTYSYKSGFDIENYWGPQRLCLRGEQEAAAVHLINTSQPETHPSWLPN